jgi:hypothetical protein
MKKQIFFLAAVILMICFGCSKDSDSPSTDLATSVAGLYDGTWDVSGTHYGTCEVTKVTNKTARLNIKIIGIQIPGVPDVTLSDGGNGKINLKYSDSSATISGTFLNNGMTLLLTDGTTSFSFTGTKN